jgi:methionyl-tRNA formyltransferase
VSDALRIVYMGTPDFSVPALEALIASKHEVVGVVTNPDRPAGRGKKLTPPPVKVAAEAAGIPVYQPRKIRKNEDAFDTLTSWAPDVAVVAAYGQILPQRFLDIPRLGCVNIHASLLPKYRGASPINAAIVHGEAESGVTIMQMEAGLDTGPMLATRSTPIGPLMTAQELHDALAQLGADMIVDTLEALDAGEVEPIEQDDSLSTYAGLMSKDDGRIDFSKSAADVANLIRGMNPWPGAHCMLRRGDDTTRVKFHLAQPVAGNGEPGDVLEANGDELVIACGEGAIQAISLQPAGKRALSPRDFNNGFQLDPATDRFE